MASGADGFGGVGDQTMGDDINVNPFVRDLMSNWPREGLSATRNAIFRLQHQAQTTLIKDSACSLLRTQLEEYSQLMEDDSKHDSINYYSRAIEHLTKGKVQMNHASTWSSGLSSSNIKIAELLPANLIWKDKLHAIKTKITDHDMKLLMEKDNATNQNLIEPLPNPSVSSAHLNKFNTMTKTDRPPIITQQTLKPNPYPQYNQRSSFIAPKADNVQINEEKPSSLPFKTARAELMIQNKRKYGNEYQNLPPQNDNNSAPKRSLGTTRSVQSKFVPPMKSSEEVVEQVPENEPIQDERLKHIDPKMIELIMNEIIDSSAPIGWDDIAGLEFAKTAIQEAVVWPLLRPDIFTGLRRPPRGILLFGPPGTGKTLIGKCIASQCSATFFSISASSLTSKWIGDGEKMVRALFAVARCHQPAVVFIDEIDSLLTQRSDTEHESTRRIKTEFLVQLDGAATGDDDRMLLIGATNRPQELDEAARRRLVKRLYIPLPDIEARHQIIARLMSTERNSLSEIEIREIAHLADGFSGADMRSLCSEAALGPIRALGLSQITNIHSDQVRPVEINDFKNALTRVRPSVSGNDLEHYTKWDKTYGSGSSR